MVQGLSYSLACEIFLTQGSTLCVLHWQVDSLPLNHQGRPPFSSFLFLPFECSTHGAGKTGENIHVPDEETGLVSSGQEI